MVAAGIIGLLESMASALRFVIVKSELVDVSFDDWEIYELKLWI